MKKFLKLVSFGIVVALLCYFSFKNIGNVTSVSNAVEDENLITVTATLANTQAGEIHLKYVDETGKKQYVDGNSVTVKKGTKVGVYFGEDGNYSLNEGYNVYCWGTVADGLVTPITTKDSEGNTYYRKELYYAVTLNESTNFIVYAKTSTSHTIAFYNSYIQAARSLLGYAFAEDGESADYSYISAPHQDGKDFDKWFNASTSENANLSNVTSDLEVYPIYSYSIYTVWRDYHSYFMKGLGVTLLLSVISVFCAMFLGMGICFIRLSNLKILKFIGAAYVEIIRGVPLLLQLLVIYIIMGPTRIHIGSFFTTEIMSCLLALFINSGAYTAEIFRSGIQSVDKGQMEAGRALGLSKWGVMLKVVMPQGIKNALPSLGNELVSMIKETSLAVSVDASIGELMSVRKQITASTYINLPPYIIVAIIYFCVTFSLSKLIGYFEKRLSSREF